MIFVQEYFIFVQEYLIKTLQAGFPRCYSHLWWSFFTWKLKPISGWCDHIWRISARFRECRHGENNNEVSHLSFLFPCFTPPPFPSPECVYRRRMATFGEFFSLFFSDRSKWTFVRVENGRKGPKTFFFISVDYSLAGIEGVPSESSSPDDFKNVMVFYSVMFLNRVMTVNRNWNFGHLFLLLLLFSSYPKSGHSEAIHTLRGIFAHFWPFFCFWPTRRQRHFENTSKERSKIL